MLTKIGASPQTPISGSGALEELVTALSTKKGRTEITALIADLRDAQKAATEATNGLADARTEIADGKRALALQSTAVKEKESAAIMATEAAEGKRTSAAALMRDARALDAQVQEQRAKLDNEEQERKAALVLQESLAASTQKAADEALAAAQAMKADYERRMTRIRDAARDVAA